MDRARRKTGEHELPLYGAAAALALFPQLAGSLRDDARVVFSGTSDDGVALVLAASELSAADVDADTPESPLTRRSHHCSTASLRATETADRQRSRSRPRGSRAVASRSGCGWRTRSATFPPSIRRHTPRRPPAGGHGISSARALAAPPVAMRAGGWLCMGESGTAVAEIR
jgi:hypothetical protein